MWVQRAAAMQGKSIVLNHKIPRFPRMCVKGVAGFKLPPKVVQQLVALCIGKTHDLSIWPPPEIERLLANDRVAHHERLDGARSVGERIRVQPMCS